MSYQKNTYDILKQFNVDPNKGLSNKDVIKQREKYGKNELTRMKKQSCFSLFINQMKDPMVYILFIGAIISSILQEMIDALIIVFVIFMNACIGVLQENKAEKAMEALEKLSSPKAKVVREGYVKEIKATSLVPGDIVELEVGGYIPADIRLIASQNLKVEESMLTGESEPVAKDASIVYFQKQSLAEQKNMVFMSCFVTYGKARGIVVATGMQTEVGKIAKLLKETKPQPTPLQQRLSHLSKVLGKICIAICILMFFIAILQGRNLLDMLLLSISLAVAAIPEGLLAVVTIVLAMGVQLMSKNKTIVKKLYAVETLGCVTMICSDKTGTLTQNKMKVMHTYANGKYDIVTKDLCKALVLCNNSIYQQGNVIGEPTENALLTYGIENGLNKNELEKEFKRVSEIAFDSNRKKMTTLHREGSNYIAYSKGALEKILEQCSFLLFQDQVLPLTSYEKNKILMESKQMSKKALRILGVAYRKVNRIQSSNLEQDMIFLGMVALMDPPREEAYHAIQTCKKAGIEVSMITGDHPDTALAIAQQLQIANYEEEVMLGHQIESCTQEELIQNIKNKKVFARVTPQHKVRIVAAFQAIGHIVSMSGDGVNDAPSLKKADIGIAMGEGGSDVCKQASDIILVDDNFATIVKAIEEGRNIYKNIKKAVLYLLSCNLGEVMVLFLAIVCMPNAILPLSAIQILWVNLVTDAFPALALGVDPKSKHSMQEAPRKASESLFAHGGLVFTILNGLLIGTVTLVAFRYGLHHSERLGQTMAFMVLSMSQLVHSLNLRSFHRSIFKEGLCKNKWLIFVFIASMLLQVFVTQFPIFQMLLKTVALNFQEWFIVFVLSSVILIVNEISKWVAQSYEDC